MLNAGISADTSHVDLVTTRCGCRQWVRMVRGVINNGYPLHRSKSGTGLVGAECTGELNMHRLRVAPLNGDTHRGCRDAELRKVKDLPALGDNFCLLFG